MASMKKVKPKILSKPGPQVDVDGQSPPPQPEQAKRTAACRWTDALVADGFTPISNFFLAHAHKLSPELTHGEMMFIVHLLFFKWDGAPPRPGFKTIAKRMGIGHARARELARGLERKKYLGRIMEKNKPNKFNLKPLFKALEALRDKLMQEMDQAAAKRKKPSVLQFG